MKCCSSLLLAAALVLGQTLPATAACPQQNLQGKWRFQLHSGNFYTLCVFSVNAAGAVASNQECTVFDATPPTGKIALAAGSQLEMFSPGTCTFSGVINLGDMGQVTLTLSNGALAPDKQTAVGVGLIDTQPFMFTLTKY